MNDLKFDQFPKVSHGESMRRIIDAGLTAVRPEDCIRRTLSRNGNTLTVGNDVFNLDEFDRAVILGAGKSSLGMAKGVAGIVADKLSESLVICKSNSNNDQIDRVKLLLGDHPLPGQRSVTATQEMLSLIATLNDRDLVFFLISGGASALLTKPEKGLELEDLQLVTDALLRSGADIHEINTVRKNLDAVKGGKLAGMLSGKTVVTLVISDVPGDRLEDVGSGPTIVDDVTMVDVHEIIDRYGLAGTLTPRINDFIANLRNKETFSDLPKKLDASRQHIYKVADNGMAVEGARFQAEKEGFQAFVYPYFVQGEARQNGMMFARMLKDEQAGRSSGAVPQLIIAGGETTVVVKGNGAGGRNQELILGAVNELAGIHNAIMMSIATDGEDGTTTACGAFATGETQSRARALHANPDEFLENNDSHGFFERVGGLIRSCPTGTNVNDLIFLLLS